MPTWAWVLYLLGLGAFSGLGGLIFYKRMRRAIPQIDESKRLLKGMPRSKKVEIRRAVRRGEAVRDPRDAPAAIATARTLLGTFSSLDRSRWRRALELFIVVYAILALALAVRGGHAPSLDTIWHLVLAAALLMFVAFWRPRMRERLRKGLEANQRLMELNLAPEPVELAAAREKEQAPAAYPYRALAVWSPVV